jgi:hypothetical protein
LAACAAAVRDTRTRRCQSLFVHGYDGFLKKRAHGSGILIRITVSPEFVKNLIVRRVENVLGKQIRQPEKSVALLFVIPGHGFHPFGKALLILLRISLIFVA